MALIKCPECGHDISTNADFCPNCGYKMKNVAFQEEKKSKLLVLASRDRNGTSVGAGIFLIVFGVFCVVFFVGVFLILAGINNISEASANNNNKHECAYYDVENRKIILYSYNGDRFVVEPEDIIDNSHHAGTENMFVKIRVGDKTKRIDCGNCSRNGSVQFKQHVEQIKNNTFDPSILDY